MTFATPAGAVPTGTDIGSDAADSDGADETVTLDSGQVDLTVDSGFITPASISGTVFKDLDNDGSIDAGEVGLPGVTVTLTGTDNLGAPVTATTTTGPDGTYTFPGLLPGIYTVTETQPTGFADGKDAAGSAGGVVGPDKVTTVSLDSGDVATGYTFGELPPASLGNFVWNDLNGNGIQDASEPGIGGVTVTLTGTDDLGATVTATTTTAADGTYSFTDLRPGTYTVTFTAPTGFQATLADEGTDDAVDSDGPVKTGITLVAGQNDPTIDTGFFEASSIAGTVYRDTDNDGVRDVDDPPIGDVVVKLTGTDGLGNPVELTVTTEDDGTYLFAGLKPGIYVITETQPIQYLDGKDTVGTEGGTLAPPDSVTAIVLSGGKTATGYDFGEIEASAIEGKVFEEAPGSPGIPDVTVTLTGTNDLGKPVTMVTTTDAGGNYDFGDLRPGTYTVTETQPTPTVYLDGTVHPTNVTEPIVLTPGVTDDTGNDFGEIRLGSIGDLVWDDRNGNGIQEGGEPGIAGVTVTLTGTDDKGAAVSLTTTTADGTDAKGSYLFAGLRPGDYTVTFTTPTGFTATPADKGTADTADSDGADEPVTLASGENNLTVDSGFFQPQRLTGVVYYDADHDGKVDVDDPDTADIDESEPGIPGVKITLKGTDGLGNPVELTATTADDGTYSFPNLAPGTYNVTAEQPEGFADGPDSAGSGGGTVKPDAIEGVVLESGKSAPDNNFGEWGWPVSGQVRFDGTDTPIPGVKITITGTDVFDREIEIVVTTDADGKYLVSDLPPGDYTVTEAQPLGLANGAIRPENTTVVKIVDAPVSGVDYTEKGGSIKGFVFYDANRNGTKDTDEQPIGNVEVTLTGTDVNGKAVSTTTKTANDGTYHFDDLVAGTYTITEVQPAGYEDGVVTAGSGGGTAGVNKVTSITLGAGANHTDYGFGETVPAGQNPPTTTTTARPVTGGGNSDVSPPAQAVRVSGPLAFTGAEVRRLSMLAMGLLMVGMSWIVGLRTPRRRHLV